jgi:hemolysin activation/secretion protein
VKSAQFRAPPAVIYDDKLSTMRLDGQLERVDTRFRGINRVAVSYTHGFNDLLGSLDAYDPGSVGGASRLGASGEFDKIAVQLRRLQRLTQFTSLVVRLEGQYSSDPLLSLEQFSLGGPDSVRAYPVAEVLAEKGGFASVELLVGAPGFATKPAFGGRTWGQVLQFSIFADYAKGQLNAPLVQSQESSVELAGVGGSIQLNVPGKVFARLDLATPLTEQEASNGRDPQYYLRFGMTF